MDNVQQTADGLQTTPENVHSASDATQTMPQTDKLELRSEGLVKIYGKRTVVNNVSFDVRQGEIVGLLGPNGAGKTTYFYMTTGLVIPNEGHIFLGGEEITKLPVYKRARLGIGYLAQEASVFRKMSVEDNISSVLEMRPKPDYFEGTLVRRLLAAWPLSRSSSCSTNHSPEWILSQSRTSSTSCGN